MAPPNRRRRDGPDLMEGLRGIAHVGDLVRRFVTGDDPRMRHKVDLLGSATVEDTLRAASEQIRGTEGVPLVDLRDTEDGIEVIIAADDTPIDCDNLSAEHEGNQLVLHDPQAGWRAPISTIKPVETTEINAKGADFAVVSVTFVGGRDDISAATPEPASPTETEDEDPELPEDTTSDADADATPPPDTAEEDQSAPEAPDTTDGDPVTLLELVENNPGVEEMLRDLLGPEGFGLALSAYEDTPVSEIPLDSFGIGAGGDNGNGTPPDADDATGGSLLDDFGTPDSPGEFTFDGPNDADERT